MRWFIRLGWWFGLPPRLFAFTVVWVVSAVMVSVLFFLGVA